MFSFFKNIFTKSEDILKDGEYKIYFCITKSTYFKIIIQDSTTCSDLLQNYHNDFLNILENIRINQKDSNLNKIHLDDYSKHLNLNKIKLEDYTFILIQNNSSGYTTINLKTKSCPLKYLKNDQNVNLFFLRKDQLLINNNGDHINTSLNMHEYENKESRLNYDRDIVTSKQHLKIDDQEKDILFQGQLLKYSSEDKKFSTKVFIKVYPDKLIMTKLKTNGNKITTTYILYISYIIILLFRNSYLPY